MRRHHLVVPLTLLLSLACNLPLKAPAAATAKAPPSLPPTSLPATAPPSLPAPPTAAATTTAPAAPQEAILILEPGPGSRLTSPVRVAGVADPAHEQTLVVRLLLDDGSTLAQRPVNIAADLGQRGAFAVDLPFIVGTVRQGFIQVFAESARDGGVTHLASVGVQLSPSGAANIHPLSPHPEQIALQQPASGATVSGGSVHVQGFGLAGFEQTLLIEVLDADGAVVGSRPVTVEAPDLGLPGPFSADVLYSVSASGPGRVVVRDVSPALGGDSHVASVEVTLAP